MVINDLKDYVRKSLINGKKIGQIREELLNFGFLSLDIEDLFCELGIVNVCDRKNSGTKSSYLNIISFLLIITLAGVSVYLWNDRLDLSDVNSKKVKEFYSGLTQAQIAFSDTGDLVFPDQQKVLNQKEEYMESGTSFIEADLKNMKISIYEDGEIKKTFEILSKGKEKSWWETPTGNYKVLGKVVNGYSTIGNVWMPYSIQFYGNYLIHGWPHYDNGTPVPVGYSGGCIRLSDNDAKQIFEFSKKDMPVLVWEDYDDKKVGKLIASVTDAKLPAIDAKAFLIIDLASNQTILEKSADEILPIASITKLMTAVVAHEVIYLGKTIKYNPGLMANVSQIFSPTAGKSYVGLDLMYPLLMQSSNDSADMLASFIGTNNFINNMNTKAKSLNMLETNFADPSGKSAQNLSTAYDLSKLIQYIYYKRPFLFEITKGIAFENVGIIKLGDTVNINNLKNFNEFVDDRDLIGVKNGQTTAAKQTMVTVWNIEKEGDSVPVAIIVLGSEDRKKTTEVLWQWLKDNYTVTDISVVE